MNRERRDDNNFRQMPKAAEIAVEATLEGQLVAVEMTLAANGVKFLEESASRVLPGVGFAIDVAFSALDVAGAVNNGTERDIAVESWGLVGAVAGGGLAGYAMSGLVATGGALAGLAASAPLAVGIVVTGVVVISSQVLEWAVEVVAGAIWDEQTSIAGIVGDTRRDRIEGIPGSDGYLGDSANEIVRDYVEAYAAGDLQEAAYSLVQGYNGDLISGDVNFHPDRIIRQQAGYDGGVPSNPNQQLARDNLYAIDHDDDPNSYPDRIIRQNAGYEPEGSSRAGEGPRTGAGGSEGGDDRREGSTGGGTAAGTGSTSSGSTSHNAANNRDRQGSGDHTATEDRRPILLDLDGNGVKITEFGNSTQFMTGTDGLQHRSSWAGAGDGVLFYDPDGRNAITETRQYVFTEWNPTAAGDLEALRSVWDTNGDGKLSAADAEFAKFKVMVTNADGSTSVRTLAELGITEIDLTANATRIEMPDGSMTPRQSTYQRANGTVELRLAA